MTVYCEPDESGIRCRVCGWVNKWDVEFPRRNCGEVRVAVGFSKELVVSPGSRESRKGVGDNLHDLIEKFMGEVPAEGCGCEQLIRQMNRWGPDGCRRHMDEIADHMVGEAKKRKWKIVRWPGSRTAAKMLIRWAIRRTENELRLPG